MAIQMVKDIIKKEDIDTWTNDRIVFISAPTGTGKSTFIFDVLAPHVRDKMILFLTNRNALKSQVERFLEEKSIHNITVHNYQKIEAQCKSSFKGEPVDLNKYDYIVCDECHYFITDSMFNRFTDMSIKEILESKPVKIMMSATVDIIKRYVEGYLKKPTIKYSIEDDFSFIDHFEFYNMDESVKEIIDGTHSDEKVLCFINDARLCLKLSNEYAGQSMFFCSKSNRLHSFTDEAKNLFLLENERFKDKVLFTTTALDNGINIDDKDVKTVIIDVTEVDTLIQCLGRRRVDRSDRNDKFNVYIKNINNRTLNGIYVKTKASTEKANYLRENGEKAYLEKYFKESFDRSGIIYEEKETGKKTINMLMYIHRLYNNGVYYGNWTKSANGYMRGISELLKRETDSAVVYEGRQGKKELSSTLKALVGRRLSEDEKNSLIDKINYREDGHLKRSASMINEYLRKSKIPFHITIERDSKKSWWKIIKG